MAAVRAIHQDMAVVPVIPPVTAADPAIHRDMGAVRAIRLDTVVVPAIHQDTAAEWREAEGLVIRPDTAVAVRKIAAASRWWGLSSCQPVAAAARPDLAAVVPAIRLDMAVVPATPQAMVADPAIRLDMAADQATPQDMAAAPAIRPDTAVGLAIHQDMAAEWRAAEGVVVGPDTAAADRVRAVPVALWSSVRSF
jgi:hypothetical protein